MRLGLFTRRGKFPKGLPKWTLVLDALRSEFPYSPIQSAKRSKFGEQVPILWTLILATRHEITLV
jgi:hypothetical protein